jgi:hypothetical protein
VADFRDFEARHRRRDVLLYLLNSRDYSCNESLLRMVLREQGYLASASEIHDDIAWLKQEGLVAWRDLGDLIIVRLLERGRDVAEGAESIAGVSRPDPRRA